MAQLNFGGVMENVITRDEFPLEKISEAIQAASDTQNALNVVIKF